MQWSLRSSSLEQLQCSQKCSFVLHRICNAFYFVCYNPLLPPLYNIVLDIREDLCQNIRATQDSINSLPTHKFKVKKNKSKENTSSAAEGGIVAAGTDKECLMSGEDAGKLSISFVKQILRRDIIAGATHNAATLEIFDEYANSTLEFSKYKATGGNVPDSERGGPCGFPLKQINGKEEGSIESKIWSTEDEPMRY